MKSSHDESSRSRTWWERNIVDDDPYDGDAARHSFGEENEPSWVGIGLALMALSAATAGAALILFVRWSLG